MRRFYIWFFTLAAIILIYFIVTGISSRESMKIESQENRIALDANSPGNGKVGRLGDVDIADLKKTQYLHRNKKGEVDREFGFEQVVRAEGSFWEIEKPYLNLYHVDFTCSMTSDRGNVRTEKVGGSPAPKDGSMNGNVVVHIVPKEGGSVKESFIYLDDISFDTEKSEASTAGPVRLESEDIEMKGRGLVFVFNGDEDKLEYLNIKEMEKMIVRTSPRVLMFSADDGDLLDSQGNNDSTISAQQPENSSDQKRQHAKDAVVQQILDKNKGRLYKWIFNKNVIIDGPEQLVFADQFCINNIPVKGTAASGTGKKSAPLQEEFVPPASKGLETIGLYKIPGYAGRKRNNIDIEITCRGGIVVVPVDSDIKPDEIDAAETVTGGKGLAEYGDTKGRVTLEARRIDYCVVSNAAELSGDCRGTMPRKAGDFERKYSMWAPKIRAEMAGGLADDSAAGDGLQHLRAYGGVVRLAVEKIQRNKLLGFNKILCLQFDYEPGRQLCTAAGPGKIEVDNSTLTEKEAENISARQTQQSDKLSLQRSCYAYVENFSKLEYYIGSNRITAQGDGQRVNIRYLPTINGQTGQLVRADVGSVDIKLASEKSGASDVSKLYATNGVTYWEEGKKSGPGRKKDIQFDGSGLLYNRDDSMISVWGDKSQGCYLNGINVEGIKYNLRTGRLEETRVLGPGMLW